MVHEELTAAQGVEIDEDRLQQLMEASKKEFPDYDDYVIWIVSMNYLLNEKGIYADEVETAKIRERRKEAIKYSVRIE